MDKQQLSELLSPRIVFRPIDAKGKRVEVDATGIAVTSQDGSVIGDGEPVEVVEEDDTAPGGAGKAYKVLCPATGGAGTSAVLDYTIDVDPGAGVQNIVGSIEIEFVHAFAENAGVSVEGVPR